MIRQVASITGYDESECEEIIDAVSETIIDALYDGDKVVWQAFCTFEVRDRLNQCHRDPKTNEVIKFPPVKVIRCNMAQIVKNVINRKKTE